MKIADIIHFSPKYRLFRINWEDRESLIEAFKDRIDGYYIKPAKFLNKDKYGFAVTLICVSLIDSLARFETGKCDKPGERFVSWVEKHFKIDKKRAKGLWQVRCGLVHETYAKNACIDYILGTIIYIENNIVGINPSKLLEKTEEVFNDYIESLKIDKNLFAIFKDSLQNDFSEELKSLKK